MKQKDVLLFIIVGIISAVLSAVVSNYLITSDQNRGQKAEIVEPITAEFNVPTSDDKYFNKNAVNPTKLIQIGDNPGEQVPFGSGGN